MRFALYKVEPIGWGRIFYVTTEQNLRPVKIENICRRIKCGSDGEICSLLEPITKKKKKCWFPEFSHCPNFLLHYGSFPFTSVVGSESSPSVT